MKGLPHKVLLLYTRKTVLSLALIMREKSSHFGLILLTLALLTANGANAQPKFIKKLFSSHDTTRASTFLPIPIISYAEETGLAFGLTGLFSFYVDREDLSNRNSTISAEAEYSTENQMVVFLKSDIWSKGNRYHYTTDIRYTYFPFYFYGIGNQTNEVDKDLVLEKIRSVTLEAEKRFGNIFYTGLHTNFGSYSFAEKNAGGLFSTDPSINSRTGGHAFFLGVSQVVDNRNSNVYTTAGSYLKLHYSFSPHFFGEDNFTGSIIKVDASSFKSLSPKLVLGVNGTFKTIQGAYIPFYLLPQLGNDMIMRGYYTGRYRDQNLVALQTELRYRFIPRVAVTTFVSAGNVYSNGNFAFDNNKYSIGAGAQYFFDVARGLSLRADFAIGEKKAGESRQDNLYITIGQSF